MVNNDSPKGSNLKSDPDEWITGNEQPTTAQLSYLSTLAREAGEEVDASKMTKAEVAKKIEDLQKKTGRG